MKWLIRLFKRPIRALIVRELKSDENRDLIIKIVNEKIDLPKLNEEEESNFLTQFYDATQEALIIAINRM